MKPKHPGRIFYDEYLTPSGYTVERLAYELKFDLKRLQELTTGQRKVRKDVAELFAALTNTNPTYWLQLQEDFDNKQPYASPATRRDRASREPKDRELRKAALELVDDGASSEQAAGELCVKKMTVAGWRASRTKGMYDHEE